MLAMVEGSRLRGRPAKRTWCDDIAKRLSAQPPRAEAFSRPNAQHCGVAKLYTVGGY